MGILSKLKAAAAARKAAKLTSSLGSPITEASTAGQTISSIVPSGDASQITGGSLPSGPATFSGGGGGSSGGGGGGSPTPPPSPTPSRFDLTPQEIKRQADALARAKAKIANASIKKAFTSRQQKALIAREQIKQEWLAGAKGLSSLEIQRRLREAGSSLPDFRSASRKTREIFKKTGITKERIIGGLTSKYIEPIIEGPSSVLDAFIPSGQSSPTTENIISAYDPTKEVSTYEPPKKSIFKTASAFIAGTLGSVKDFSSRQSSYVGAEASLGVGGVSGVDDKTFTNIVTPNAAQIAKINKLETNKDVAYKNYQDITHVEIPKLKEQFGKDTSKYTPEQLTEYNKLVEKQISSIDKYSTANEEYQNRVQSTSKTFSSVNPLTNKVYQRQVPVTELTSPFGYVGAQADTFVEHIGKNIGKGYSDILSGVKIGKKPDAVIDLNTNIFRSGLESDRPTITKNLLTPEVVSKTTTGALKLGSYFIPYVGATTFTSEVGESMSQVDYSPKRYVKEKPMEALMLGGVLLGVGAFKGYKYLKSPRLIKTAEGLKVTSRVDEALGKKVVVKKGDTWYKPKVTIKPSTRGRYFERIPIESPTTNIKVVEPYGLDAGKKVLFPKQKVYQTGSIGERTVVREGKRILYEGIPYTQRAQYAEQFNYLSKLFGEKSARNILRYSQSQSVIQRTRGILNIKKDVVAGKAISYTEKPVIIIDKSLGIKTRGRKTQKYIESISRKGGKGNAVELSVGINLEKGKNIVNLKEINFEGGIVESKASDILKVGEIEAQRLFSRTTKTYLPRTNEINIVTGRTLLLRGVSPAEARKVLRGGKVKSSQQYLDSLYAPELKSLEVKNYIKLPKKTPTNILENLPELKPVQNLPSMVGGTGLVSTPAYTGAGLYEQAGTTGFRMQTIPPQTLTGITQPTIIETPNIKVDTKVSQIISQQPQVGQRELSLLKDIQQSRPKSGMDIRIDIKQQPSQKSPSKTILKSVLGLKSQQKTLQQTLQKTAQQTAQRNVQRTIQKTRTPINAINIPIIKIPIRGPAKRALKEIAEGSGFEIFARKGGIDIEIGETQTLGGAKELLKKKLKSGLQASGFIKTKGGEKLSFAELGGFGPDFRISKKDLFRVVELKQKRLRKATTGKDIQFFRKQKKNKGLFN